jgi:hypothetical protein
MSKAKVTKPTPAAESSVPTLPYVVLTADTLIALVDRVNKLEAKVSQLEDEAQKNFDTLCEHIPSAVEGGLKFKAFNWAGDGYEEVILPRAEAATPSA